MTVTLNRGSITSLMSSSQAVSTLQPVASELKTQLENKLKVNPLKRHGKFCGSNIMPVTLLTMPFLRFWHAST